MGAGEAMAFTLYNASLKDDLFNGHFVGENHCRDLNSSHSNPVVLRHSLQTHLLSCTIGPQLEASTLGDLAAAFRVTGDQT